MKQVEEPIGLYKINRSSPTCLDLFSGAGGLSIGFAMAGGSPSGAVDNDADSIATYRRNFPLAKEVACCPIEKWRPSTRKRHVDVIVGGPPCQGFSLARGLRFADDPRNHLYKYFVNIVKLIRPKWLVMENVEGITNIGGGAILAQILEDFARLGYPLEYRVVNMALHGVPQSRKRAIFVGNRLGRPFVWPMATHQSAISKAKVADMFEGQLLPLNSVNSVLSDLVVPQGNYFSHRANSQMRGPRNRCAHTEPAFTLRVRGDEFALCQVPATKAFVPGPAPSEQMAYREPNNELQEMLRNSRPTWVGSHSLNKSQRIKRLPLLKGTRRLTIREQARLQTFPDWFGFVGKTTSQARQIGNAVPPLFAYKLFKQIVMYL